MAQKVHSWVYILKEKPKNPINLKGYMHPSGSSIYNTLRVPWTARRSNQSILKEISPGISLEGMMLKLKLQ